MEFVSVIIPTYNRLSELVLTIPQVTKYLDENSELIIFDQSEQYEPEEHLEQLKEISSGCRIKYYHCSVPSVPLAWNTAARLARGAIILFLDDDVNLDTNILAAHRKYYAEDPDIIGVAGGYYASTYDRTWIPSSHNGLATTLAGVNTSFRKESYLKSGCASGFIKSFAGFDWELAEHFNAYHGNVVVGHDALVFHRAPASGGCGNQAERQVSWYYGCYHNHVLWMLHRKFPQSLTKLPRHCYSIIRYCMPKREVLFSRDFFRRAIFCGIRDAFRTHKHLGGERSTAPLPLEGKVRCVFEQESRGKEKQHAEPI